MQFFVNIAYYNDFVNTFQRIPLYLLRFLSICDMVIAVTDGDEEPDVLTYSGSKGKPIMYMDANIPEVRQ